MKSFIRSVVIVIVLVVVVCAALASAQAFAKGRLSKMDTTVSPTLEIQIDPVAMAD